ncbi:hypothetical protein [Streptomyces sp. NPDC048196]
MIYDRPTREAPFDPDDGSAAAPGLHVGGVDEHVPVRCCIRGRTVIGMIG